MRRKHEELADDAAQELRTAIASLGLGVGEIVSDVEMPADLPADFVFEVGGEAVAVHVQSVVATTDAKILIEQARKARLPFLVASERIADSARAELREAGVGYFDRRGRLRLVLPGIFVDAEVPGRAPHSTRRAPLSGETSKEVALVLLAEPSARRGVREIARTLERSPSSVSAALQGLREVGLTTSANEPLVPDLFWELEAVWRRQAIALADLPRPGTGRTDQLGLGLGHRDGSGQVLDEVGWALTDTMAAVAWGVPIVVSSDYPPDFYVPSQALLTRALSMLRQAQSPAERACTVAVAPARFACKHRASLPGQTWPVASHVVVALDLAMDRARGREALDHWNPQGHARVW
jgi:DNA-binding transcriptional ArsR family regulator